jgi:hypothetical protein
LGLFVLELERGKGKRKEWAKWIMGKLLLVGSLCRKETTNISSYAY